jgi:hypothetical protein
MKLHHIDQREIRSFHLRKKMLTLKQFFDQQNSFGVFMMMDTLQPSDRINNRKDFFDNDFTVKSISKKIVIFLTKNSAMTPLQNLLKGNVVLFYNKTNNTIYKPNQLRYLLKKDNNMYPRFLYWNQTIYREKDLCKLISNNETIKSVQNLSLLIKQISLKTLTVNPFICYKK